MRAAPPAQVDLWDRVLQVRRDLMSIWQARDALERHYGNPTLLRDRIGIIFARAINEYGLVWWSSDAVRGAVLGTWPDVGHVSPSWLRETLARLPDWTTVGYRQQRRGGPGRGVAVRALREPLRFQIGIQPGLREACEWGLRTGVIASLATPQNRQPGSRLNPFIDAAVGSYGPDKEQEHHLNLVRANTKEQETTAGRSRGLARIRRSNDDLGEQFLIAIALDSARDERLAR
jgi:hypothetical protein